MKFLWDVLAMVNQVARGPCGLNSLDDGVPGGWRGGSKGNGCPGGVCLAYASHHTGLGAGPGTGGASIFGPATTLGWNIVRKLSHLVVLSLRLTRRGFGMRRSDARASRYRRFE